MQRPVALVVCLLAGWAAGAQPSSTRPAKRPLSAAQAPPSELAPATAEQLERELATATREESRTRRLLQQTSQQAAKQQAATIAYGRAYVRACRSGLLPVAAGLHALLDHASSLQRVRHAVVRGQHRQEQLAQNQAALAQRLEQWRARRTQLEAHRTEMAQAHTALMAAQDRRLAFERAFSSSGPVSHTAVYGAATGPSDPETLTAGFVAMRGRLPFPLPGRTEVVAIRRAESAQPGLEMRAPLGSPVRTVYAGRVAFADEYATYGKTVIIDHGEQYFSVSANLGEIGVAAGDELAVGSRIGTVGDTGTGPKLYFEIRRGAEVLDPTHWFGI